MDEHCWQSGLADGEDIVLVVTTVSLVSRMGLVGSDRAMES